MSKDYTSVDGRHVELEGIELVKKLNELCADSFGKVLVWSPELMPHRLLITMNQFKELAKLQDDEHAKPTGKEIFKTADGYLFEVIVGEE